MAREPYIDPEAFKREAEQLAGASEWGGDGFEEAYERFIAALNAEAELTPQGVKRTRSHIRKLLVGRLKLFRDRQLYDDVAREEIRAPLFLTGQSRSGTSYFNALLACDERNHALSHWQVWTLSPPPGLPGVDTAPLVAAGERFIEFEGWQDPDVRTTHNYTATNAAEDLMLHDYAFRSGSFRFFWNVPSFAAWLQTESVAPIYRFEKKALQALQYGRQRDRWVLKTPSHLRHLDELFAEFPDARVVVNHRDPVKCLGSIVSMLKAHRKQFGNAPVDVGRDFMLASMEGTARNLERLIARRKDPEMDKRFVDVDYLRLEADPLGEVEKAYARHGVAFTDAARKSMERHVAENRKGKFGAHKYDVTDTGLRVEEIRDRFKFYTDHYDIRYEA